MSGFSTTQATPDFLIGGMLSGTGVRDAVKGGYVEPKDIGLSPLLAADLSAWRKRCEGRPLRRLSNG